MESISENDENAIETHKGKMAVSDENATTIIGSDNEGDEGMFDEGSTYLAAGLEEALNVLMKEKINWKSMRTSCSGNYSPFRQVDTSMTALSRIMERHGAVYKPTQVSSENANMYTLNKHPHQMYDVCIKFNDIYKKLNPDTIGPLLPGRFHYMPPGGAYGWNNNVASKFKSHHCYFPDWTYFIYCDEHGKSIVKYLKGNEIFEVALAKGWSAFRIKSITWHCIESSTNTIMLGFVPKNRDPLGFCDKNHYIAEGYSNRNFVAGKTDNEKVNEINAIFTSLQTDPQFSTPFLDCLYFSLPLRFLDHVGTFKFMDIYQMIWDGKEDVTEDSDDQNETLDECIKRHADNLHVVTLLQIGKDNLRCMYGHHILSEIYAKHISAERKRMEEYEKNLMSGTEQGELDLPVTKIQVRIVHERHLDVVEQQIKNLGGENSNHIVKIGSGNGFNLHLPTKLYDRNNEDYDSENEDEEPPPQLLPGDVIEYLLDNRDKDFNEDMNEDMKSKLLQIVMQVYINQFPGEAKRSFESILPRVSDIHVKLIDSDKEKYINDEVNGKNIFKFISNLHDEFQYIELKGAEHYMDKDRRVEKGECIYFVPCPLTENYCIDNLHRRRLIGKGSWLEATIVLKDHTMASLLESIEESVIKMAMEAAKKEEEELRLKQQQEHAEDRDRLPSIDENILQINKEGEKKD